MPDFKYQRDTNRFFCLGLDLNRPVDAVKDLQYPLLKNVRTYQIGRLEPRPGMTLIGSVSGSVHSIRRLNTPRTDDWTRVIGSGHNLSVGQSSFTQIDTGYSGDPLALVPYRPAQSPDPWMYVMDSARQRKVDVDGTLHLVGLPPPVLPPVVGRTAIHHKVIFSAVMSDVGWTGGPSFVGSMAIEGPYATVNTNISDIVYDTGNTGWCVIYPTLITGIGSNMLITLGGTSEDVVVQRSSNGFPDSTTIASISATPDGNYAVVLSTIKNGIIADGIIENSTRSSKCRIKAVIDGPSEVQTIICSAGADWAAGDTVYIRSAFRCYTTYTHSAGDTVKNTALRAHTNITQDLSLPLTGYVRSPKFTPALDLSKITSDISSTPDSYIAINLRLSDPNDTTEVKVMLGCKNVAATSDEAFDTDYFYVSFTPDKLDSSSGMKIKLAELLKVGSPSLKNIYYVQIETTIRAPVNEDEREDYHNIETFTFFHSIYLGGEPGPDIGVVGMPYIYRYRARCSSTGVVSNWSPPTLEGYLLTGEPVTLAAPSQYTLASEADKIDFQRRGGHLPNDWYYVGSVDNSVAPTSFTDKYPDDIIVVNPTSKQEHYQLWPILGAPVSGTGAVLSGVMLDGGNFSTTWAPDTQILINGVWYTIYQVHSAGSLQLYESGGYQSSVDWEVSEPLIQGQPMPCFWGPLAETFFGCGDSVNPQRVYWTNPGSADDTSIPNYLDVTTPSEPLMNGVVYNGRSYVWSSERLFQLLPDSPNEAGIITSWHYIEIPNGKGLFGRWAFTGVQSPPGLILYWLGREGIYATDGGGPSSITDEDMRPLFPNEGNLGEEVNTIKPPNVIKLTAAQHRLAYIDDYLYYDYADTSYTPPTPLTFTASDSLFGMADSVSRAGGGTSLGLSDALSTPADAVAVMLTHGFASADSALNLADQLNVIRTL